MAAPPPAAPGTVALLIDLVALQAQAQAQGGELAFRRLRDGLAGSHTIDRAFCFAPAGTTPPAGFDLAPSQDTLVGGIRFAAKALDLLGRSGQIVLAPPSEAMRELANTLRKGGHRVELVGFLAEGDEPPDTRRLGRDCLFVP